MFRPQAVVVSAAVFCWAAFVSASTQASSFADFVVSYNPGTSPAAGFTNTTAVLGAPTASATVTAPPFQKTQILSLGFGGSLIVGFNSPVSNNPANPFGLDFTIFNNSFFTLSGSTINGVFTHAGLTVYASQDDTNFYLLSSSTNNGAGGLYPTAGAGNPFLPVNPALGLSAFTGGTTSNALALYNGSAGGASYDLSSAIDTNSNPVNLNWISYVEIINTSTNSVGEIDAFAVVPEPSSLILVVTASLGVFVFKRHRRLVLGLAIAAFAAQSTLASTSLTENFSSNPFGTWSFGIGDNSNNQFTWTNTPGVYTGDSNGELDVHLNSSLPTARLQRPLGVMVTDTNDFTLTTRFSFHIISAPGEQGMQIAFGLVNSSLTGGDRTGTSTNFNSDNTFHTVEFNYFPNVSTFFNSGPTLTPAVTGAQTTSNADAFGNFASIFGPDSDLGDNTNGVTELPQDVTLEATLAYDGASKTLALTVSQVNSNGTLTLIDTEVPSMDLVANGYNTNFPFRVDTLAIMAYQDGFTTTNDPSLVADLRFQGFDFTTSASAPQPPGFVSISIVGTNVSLAFPTIATSLYDVQSRTDLASGSWSTIASNIVGTGGLVTNIDVGGAVVPRRFYRVGLQTN
ncbi:MAG TPA: PEP-CTERM sorting domain-containing protein [Verrucomicrobiae bacterium]|nr:PEP-CTERM sorting domain-containing protein [Verrucomicrobiae bacterium]